MTPKRLVLFGIVPILVLCCGGAALVGVVFTRAVVDTAGKVDFINPLAVPPLAPSTVDESGRRVFELRASTGTHDFGAGPVGTWGYNGAYLGPTLRAARGEQVVINVRNELTVTTTVHWHGMHLPAVMDGGPHQPVAASQTWSPTWRVNQPATTLWYHPHPHGETAGQVYRGLAGLFIIDDLQTDVPALPHRYGVDDMPVIVQDKRFDGSDLDEGRSLLGGVGILGDTIAVNGTVGPYLDVTTERVRLRLLNASNARSYAFGFSDDRSFTLVGTDGGLLAEAYETSSIALSPGERAEIVVTVHPGERAVLRSAPPELGLDPLSNRFSGGADTFDILQLRAATQLAPSRAVPARLVPVPRLDPATSVQTREFRLNTPMINGRGMDMGRVDATVVKNTVEIWKVTNQDGSPHTFHIHDVQFQVRSINGRQPPPELRGWKDTVFLRPNAPYELIVPFSDYSDETTPYMFHCHLLYHEDQGMMGQFVVVEPGQRAGTPVHGGHG